MAGLKVEDLPSEEIDQPTTAGNSSTLSESQYIQVEHVVTVVF